MSLVKKIKYIKNNISLSSWLFFWYFFTCIVFSATSEYLFHKYISILNNKTEEINLDSNFHDLVELIESQDKLNKEIFEGVVIFLDHSEDTYLKVEDINESRILYISPGMNEFLGSLKKNKNDVIIPDDEINIRKKNNKYYYYVKKYFYINERSLNIEYLAEKTEKVFSQIETERKIFYVSLVVLLILLLMSIVIIKFILKPIDQIVDGLNKINSSNLDQRLRIKWVPKDLLIIKRSFNNVLARLEDSFQRVSQFSDDIVHEIRTPVNILKGEIEVSLQSKRSNKEYVNILHSNLEECNRLSEIIDSLTFLSRTEKKDIVIQAEKLNIYNELLNLKDLYTPFADEKSVKIIVSCDENMDAYLDKILFLRIVSNLISNSINYNKVNGEVLIKAILLEQYLEIEVSDTGIGISEAYLSQIFDRFYRVDNIRNNKKNNLGLGLSMVKSMVKLHNGFIELKSKKDLGTTVIVRLPQNNNSDCK